MQHESNSGGIVPQTRLAKNNKDRIYALSLCRNRFPHKCYLRLGLSQQTKWTFCVCPQSADVQVQSTSCTEIILSTEEPQQTR